MSGGLRTARWSYWNPVRIAAIIGFVVPAFWLALRLLLFNAPANIDPPLRAMQRFTDISETWGRSWPIVLGPIVNAAVYAAVCGALRLMTGRSLVVRRRTPTTETGLDARRELKWMAASAVAGAVGTLLIDTPEVSDLLALAEAIATMLVVGPILGTFVYGLLAMGRVCVWCVTTREAP